MTKQDQIDLAVKIIKDALEADEVTIDEIDSAFEDHEVYICNIRYEIKAVYEQNDKDLTLWNALSGNTQA